MGQYTKAIKLSTLRKSANNLYNSVVFFATPDVTESRNVSYVEISDIRQPASILIYMGSPSRNFSITAKLIARSQAEANVSFRNLNVLKSWCITHATIGSSGQISRTNAVGKVTNLDPTSPSDINAINAQDGTTPGTQVSTSIPNTFTAGDLFTDTPQVVLLEGYSGQFRRIPVVITGLTVNFSSDVDYIQTSTGVDVPIMQDVNIQLKEARNITGRASIASLTTYNLQKFKEGTLDYW